MTIEYWTGSAWSSPTTLPDPWEFQEQDGSRSKAYDTVDGWRAIVKPSTKGGLVRLSLSWNYTTQSQALYDTLKTHLDEAHTLRLQTGSDLDGETYFVRVASLSKDWVVVNGEIGYNVRATFEEMPDPSTVS